MVGGVSGRFSDPMIAVKVFEGNEKGVTAFDTLILTLSF